MFTTLVINFREMLSFLNMKPQEGRIKNPRVKSKKCNVVPHHLYLITSLIRSLAWGTSCCFALVVEVKEPWGMVLNFYRTILHAIHVIDAPFHLMLPTHILIAATGTRMEEMRVCDIRVGCNKGSMIVRHVQSSGIVGKGRKSISKSWNNNK